MTAPLFKTARRLSSVLLMLSLLSGILLVGKASAQENADRANSAGEAKSLKEKYSALAAYATDLTKLARQGKLDPVADHEKEIRQLAQILSRENRNNPVLIGEGGFGRSIIVAGLAYKMASGDVPEFLL